MTPTLRSVISQANRSWRSVAPRRNFSSSPHESKTAGSNFILRGLAMGVGYVIGEVYWRDWVQETQREHDEYNEYFDRSEKMWADLAAEQDGRVYDPKVLNSLSKSNVFGQELPPSVFGIIPPLAHLTLELVYKTTDQL